MIWNDEKIARARQEYEDLVLLVRQLKTGSCWCEAGIDNPNMRGHHSRVCLRATRLLARPTVFKGTP